uniref:NADH dehydrogenase subunit 6 n=1 Tax=Marcia recens TaxID=2490373 RepID=UPI002236F208|nr:NADH dehydrogenase subunit 6 [Marcia recens]UYR95112.1 NADH dehydrogenase subunit 6 [Marcia recens]
MEFVMMLCCLGSLNVMSRYNHPMFFGFVLLVLVVGMSGVVSFFNGVYGFMLFMCIVSGIMVVFAYSVALVPLSLNVEKSYKLIDQEKSLFSQLEKNVLIIISSMVTVLTVLCLLVLWSFMSSGVSMGCFYSITYFTSDWGIGISLLGFLLFLVMVFCVSVASKYSGALVK